jgi:hypothetical protein
MSASLQPSSSAAKPLEYQKHAVDTAMLTGGVAKPTHANELESAPANAIWSMDVLPSGTDDRKCRMSPSHSEDMRGNVAQPTKNHRVAYLRKRRMSASHSEDSGGSAAQPADSTGDSITCCVKAIGVAKSHEVNRHPRDKHIFLDEMRHVYVYTSSSGTRTEFPISVSGVWEKYFQKFDPVVVTTSYFERWAENPSSKYYEDIATGRACGRTDSEIQIDIMDAWTARGAAASRDGTYMHKQIELALNCEIYDDSLSEMRHFLSWVREVPVTRSWILFRSEWSIFSRKAVVAGQVDALFTDSRGSYHMVDWKRCREPLDPVAKAQFGRMGKQPLEKMVDNQHSHYSVQQNIYREILRNDYNISLQSMTLLRCHPDAATYEAVSVPEIPNEIIQGMLENATVGLQKDAMRNIINDREPIEKA